MGWFSPNLESPSANRRLCRFWFLVFTWLLCNPAFAATLETTLQNLRQLVIPLTELLLILSFVLGISFIWHAIVAMKHRGMMMNQQSQPGELASIIAYLVVGAVLVWLPTSSNLIADTFFGGGQGNLFSEGAFDFSALGTGAQLMSYTTNTSVQAQWTAVANTLVVYIQFIGLIAFIRGWVILSKMGKPGTPAETTGKALTHIIGGIIAINFVQFIQLIKETLGL